MIFRQIFRQLNRGKRLALGSFLVLFITLLLVDLFWIGGLNSREYYSRLLDQVKMEVFIFDDHPDSLIPATADSLKNITDVDSLMYISKDDAAAILENDLGPGILNQLETNPLPRSFVLSFRGGMNLSDLEAVEGRIMQLAGIDTIEYGRQWIAKVERTGDIVRRLGFGLGLLIVMIVLLTMANTNRLMARSKSNEFFQLSLLGAGDVYLVIPFLAEGFLSGLVAAILGWVLVYFVHDQVSFAQFTIYLPDITYIAAYCLGAGIIGMIGAYFGIRRMLKL